METLIKEVAYIFLKNLNFNYTIENNDNEYFIHFDKGGKRYIMTFRKLKADINLNTIITKPIIVTLDEIESDFIHKNSILGLILRRNRMSKLEFIWSNPSSVNYIKYSFIHNYTFDLNDQTLKEIFNYSN